MTKYQRITSTSKKLSFLCLMFIILIPPYLAYNWLFPYDFWFSPMPFGYSLEGFKSWPPTLEKQILGITICYIPGFFIMKVLWHFKQLFSLYAKGIFFTEDNVELYHKSTSAAFWFIVFWIAAQSLLTVAMSYDTANPMISLTFNPSHILALFVTTLLRVITWVMSTGQELAAENQSFI